MPAGDQRRRLRVVIADETGRRVPASGVSRWLSDIAPKRAAGTVAVALVSDRVVRSLNRRYRRTDRATDVLSFPVGYRPRGSRPFLGDIVIARGVARRQARRVGHSELTELRILALHGLLHLLGYDHHRDNGRMLRVERRLRRKGGLKEGLIEREGATRPERASARQDRPERARARRRVEGRVER